MAWPSTLTSFTDPQPTDRLNSPSHSSIETNQNTGLEELQTYIGVITGASASVQGTILYDIKSPSSNGGGHVQTANKGGTGQTTFTKGDILVAAGSSTLSKLAVGTSNQILQVDSGTATGIKWAVSPGGKIHIENTIYTPSSLGEYSILSASVLGSTLGSSNAIKATTYINHWQAAANPSSMIATYFYGGSRVASIAFVTLGNGLVRGTLTHTMIASTTGVQKNILEADFISSDLNSSSYLSGPINFRPSNTTQNPSVAAIVKGHAFSFSSINSSATQNYGITIHMTNDTAFMSVAGTILEKIQP